MIKRRSFLTAAGGAAIASVTGFPHVRRARAADEITVVSPFGFSPSYTDLFNAYSAGYYADEGLDANVIATRGVQSIQLLVAGKAQFIRNTGVDLINGVENQSLPLVSIGTLCQASTYNFVSLKDKPVEKPEDLKGKTVGILSAKGGASSTYLELLLHSVGLTPQDIQMQVTGNSPGEIEFLRQGRVDCFMCLLDVVTELKKSKAPIIAWNTDEYFKMPCQIYVTTTEIAEKNPELVNRFMRAIKKSAFEMMSGSLKDVFTRIQKDFEMTGLDDMDDAVLLQKRRIQELWLSQGKENVLRNVPSLWESGAQAMLQTGLIKHDDPTRYYTNTFVDAALKT